MVALVALFAPEGHCFSTANPVIVHPNVRREVKLVCRALGCTGPRTLLNCLCHPWTKRAPSGTSPSPLADTLRLLAECIPRHLSRDWLEI